MLLLISKIPDQLMKKVSRVVKCCPGECCGMLVPRVAAQVMCVSIALLGGGIHFCISFIPDQIGHLECSKLENSVIKWPVDDWLHPSA